MKHLSRLLNTRRRRLALAGAGALAFAVVLSWSGFEAFTRQTQPVPLAATQPTHLPNAMGERPAPRFELEINVPQYEVINPQPQLNPTREPEPDTPSRPTLDRASQPNRDPAIKLDRMGKPILVNGKPWTGEVFDYRPIRPLYTRTMKTTAYSPDERSCGKWADGITASGKSVWMNGGKLVAADRAVPYGTILTIPGYNNNKPVQVWDRGGKIKGNRLDLLYPTHEIALQWGVQDLPVVFWEFVETD